VERKKKGRGSGGGGGGKKPPTTKQQTPTQRPEVKKKKTYHPWVQTKKREKGGVFRRLRREDKTYLAFQPKRPKKGKGGKKEGVLR